MKKSELSSIFRKEDKELVSQRLFVVKAVSVLEKKEFIIKALSKDHALFLVKKQNNFCPWQNFNFQIKALR